MADEKLKNFRLVGGTALALQLGHRLSIDIDLFSRESFDEDALGKHMIDKHQLSQKPFFKNSLKGIIDGVAVDIITHAYEDVRPPLVIENIRMASLYDIAAMKLNAILGNGERLKDFVDVAYLSQRLSLINMIDSFQKKYPMQIKMQL